MCVRACVRACVSLCVCVCVGGGGGVCVFVQAHVFTVTSPVPACRCTCDLTCDLTCACMQVHLFYKGFAVANLRKWANEEGSVLLVSTTTFTQWVMSKALDAEEQVCITVCGGGGGGGGGVIHKELGVCVCVCVCVCVWWAGVWWVGVSWVGGGRGVVSWGFGVWRGQECGGCGVCGLELHRPHCLLYCPHMHQSTHPPIRHLLCHVEHAHTLPCPSNAHVPPPPPHGTPLTCRPTTCSTCLPRS